MKSLVWANNKSINKPIISLLYQGNSELDMFLSVHGSLELPILKYDYEKVFSFYLME